MTLTPDDARVRLGLDPVARLQRERTDRAELAKLRDLVPQLRAQIAKLTLQHGAALDERDAEREHVAKLQRLLAGSYAYNWRLLHDTQRLAAEVDELAEQLAYAPPTPHVVRAGDGTLRYEPELGWQATYDPDEVAGAIVDRLRPSTSHLLGDQL